MRERRSLRKLRSVNAVRVLPLERSHMWWFSATKPMAGVSTGPFSHPL